MEIRGRPAERRSASAARTRRGLSWKAWAQDLDEHLQRIEDLMWPNLFILGGGVSKNADKFVPRLTLRTPVVPAQLRNDAGIIGAAIVAVEGLRDAKSTWDDLPEATRPRRRRSAELRAYHRRPFPPLRHAPEVPIMTTEPTAPPARPDRPRATRMVIGGESVDAADGQTFEIVNPATGKTIATAPLGGRDDVDRAVAAAQAAFEERKGWANWAAGKRGRSLAKLADLIKKNSEELAWLESRNGGKPITSARGEIIGASLVFDYYAGAANKIYRPDDPGLEAGHRPDPARADRRRRADRAVELPAADGRLEGRARRWRPATPRSSSPRRTRR